MQVGIISFFVCNIALFCIWIVCSVLHRKIEDALGFPNLKLSFIICYLFPLKIGGNHVLLLVLFLWDDSFFNWRGVFFHKQSEQQFFILHKETKRKNGGEFNFNDCEFLLIDYKMGMVKLKIKRLESTSNQQVTYSKRRNEILKKAKELSILCDIDIVLLMFSPTGRPTLFQGDHRWLSRNMSLIFLVF